MHGATWGVGLGVLVLGAFCGACGGISGLEGSGDAPAAVGVVTGGAPASGGMGGMVSGGASPAGGMGSVVAGGAAPAGGSVGSAIGRLGEHCTVGANACAAHAQRARLACVGGVWSTSGSCPSGQNCDTRPGLNAGSCEPIVAPCANAQPTRIVCLKSSRIACEEDLVSTSVVEVCADTCVEGECVAHLTAIKNGDGSGTVTANPAGINCGARCSATYNQGTMVTLAAAPANGSTFAGWSGVQCSGTAPCTLTLAAATTVTATFTQTGHTLTVNKVGNGSGTITAYPPGISCGATCSANYDPGTMVTLTAAPANGSSFAGWSGATCVGSAQCTVTMLAATTVTARFPHNETLAAGGYHTCGVKTDGSVACWGRNDAGQATPPAGTFTALAAGRTHTCGVKTDGFVTCWGDNSYAQGWPQGGPFTQVSAGDYHTCGVKTDESVACWGGNGYGQATPPAGSFTQVSASVFQTCGVKTDGSVVCWGYDASGQAVLPGGTFTQLSFGYAHTCGVKTDGSVVCWGYDANGQATPPAGTFTQLSAGSDHTCGVKTDRSLACWGGNAVGQTVSPAGTFTQVSAGDAHTCGVRTDGTLVCWGVNISGEATPPAGTFL